MLITLSTAASFSIAAGALGAGASLLLIIKRLREMRERKDQEAVERAKILYRVDLIETDLVGFKILIDREFKAFDGKMNKGFETIDNNRKEDKALNKDQRKEILDTMSKVSTDVQSVRDLLISFLKDK